MISGGDLGGNIEYGVVDNVEDSGVCKTGGATI